MKIYIGADHRGYKLKQELRAWLTGLDYEVVDMGAESYNPDDDYVDFAVTVSQAVSKQKNQQLTINNQQFGILICGSGHGVDIVANHFKNIRSIIGFNREVAKQGREHEDANVLSLPADWISVDEARATVKEFLETPFSRGERHLRRLEKINKLPIY